MTNVRVAFVCRGSTADGLGHVMRSTVVAEATAREAEVTLIAVGDETPRRLLAEAGVESRIVSSDGELRAEIDRLEPDGIVFDMIEIDRQTFGALKERRLTAALSPIFNALSEVDLAFNRTRYLVDGSEGHDPDSGRYCGLDFAVVRPACRRIETGTFARHLDETDLSIAISMGGADAPNRTLSILEALRGLAAPAIFWTILGEGYGHSYRELVDCVRRDTRHEIILAKTNRSMWRTLGNCSLAILAGGITTYEAAYAGLPSVNVLGSTDDRFLVRELVEQGAAFEGGVESDGLETMLTTVAQLASDREQLLVGHRSSRTLVDGQGAERIAAVINDRLHAREKPEAAVG